MKFVSTFTAPFILYTCCSAQSTPSGFAPSANTTLDVYYGTQYVSPGTLLKKSATQRVPTIGLTNTTLTGKYLLAMIDIDGSSSNKPTTVLHTLLTDFAPSATPLNGTTVLTTTATGPSSYFGPAPPAGQPPEHRYVFVLHRQPSGFAVPQSQQNAVRTRLGIDWVTFVKEAKLAEPVAGSWIRVKSGDSS